MAASELPYTDPSGFDKIDSEKVEQTIYSINEALKEKQVDKKVRQKLNDAKNYWPAALKCMMSSRRSWEPKEAVTAKQINTSRSCV